MTPEALEKYRKDPQEILGAQVLPPPTPSKTGLRGKGFGGGTGSIPRYPTPEALQHAINLYFQRLEITEDPPTIPDLVLALGFSQRQTLRDYHKRGEDYAHVVDMALTRIEGWKNRFLLKGGATTQAAIFDLKNNHHWADKVEQTTTVIPGGSLAELVQALQGQVLRPALIAPEESIVEAEFTAEVEPTQPIAPKRKPRFGHDIYDLIINDHHDLI